MAPKKGKGKKAGKKGKKKGKKGALLDEEDKLKLKTREVETLKDHLAYRTDFSRQAKAAYEELKQRYEDTNLQIQEVESVHKSSNAYLTHQYKTMQNEMAIKVHQVETELNATRKQLEATEQALQNEITDKKRLEREKNDIIFDLEEKIRNIRITYDSVIQLTLDRFNQNLDKKKLEWENNSTRLQVKNKNLLAELGLKIHDIWIRFFFSIYIFIRDRDMVKLNLIKNVKLSFLTRNGASKKSDQQAHGMA